jgi:hypothetical protein
MLSSSASMVTNMRHIAISSYTWMLAWPNASSVVTLASNGSDMGLFLSVARAAKYIVLWQEAPKDDLEE